MQVWASFVRVGWITTLALAAVVAGCGDDDTSVDYGEVNACEEPFEFTAGDPDGHADPLGVEPGQARAGRLAADQLPADPYGLSVVDPDDFVLANEHIALIIEDAGPADLWDEWGGKPVGMGLMRDGAIVDPVDFNELILSIGTFVLNTESVTVLEDGSDGGSAIIRSTGTLDELGSLGELIELASWLRSEELSGIQMAMDYELAPGAEHVDVTVHLVNTTEEDIETHGLHLFFQESRSPLFTPELGFVPFPMGHEAPFVAFVDPEATNYAWELPPDAPGPDFYYFLAMSGATVFQFPEYTTEACRVQTQPAGRFHIGGPGLDGLRATMARTRGEAQRAISGTVTQADGEPGAGVSVHATQGEGESMRYLSRTTTAADGSYTIHVPADESVQLTTWRRGDRPVTHDAGPGDDSVNFELLPVGHIQLAAVDDEGTPLPVRVQVMATEGNPTPDYFAAPPAFGEPRLPSGRLHVEFPADGQVRMRVPPGDYRVVVSRGFDYDIWDNDVEVSGGDEVDLGTNVQLTRVITSPGHLCGDFHIHTFRSPDAGDPKDHKILASIGDGVELPVLTDHRFVGDFEETIEEMEADGYEGISQWAYGISALELTTFVWGHMCVAPLEVQHDQQNGGFVNWVGRPAPEVFDEVRSRPSGYDGVDPAVIIAHGRAFGGMAFGEYFSAVNYQHRDGIVRNEELWDDRFRLVEVFNSDSFDDMIGSDGMPRSTLRDWFSFLTHMPDREFFAVGSSDSHNVLASNSPVGYPRTCIDVGMDTPDELRNGGGGGHVRNVMYEEGNMTVHGGIYVTVTARDGDVSMGGTVDDAEATETLHVRVEAPCWIDVADLELWVNGVMPADPGPHVIPLAHTNDSESCDPVRFDDTIDVTDIPETGRSWAVVHVAGTGGMDPVFPGKQPFGVTNPIFFMP